MIQYSNFELKHSKISQKKTHARNFICQLTLESKHTPIKMKRIKIKLQNHCTECV